MKFSVIIPSHNAAPYVGDALASVAAQSTSPHEVIVVDDDSKDNTVEVVKQCGFATKVIQVQHHNAAATRNEGIKEATGDWIAFLDSDDTWMSDHLMHAMEVLSDSDDIAYTTNRRSIYGDGEIEDVPDVPNDTPETGLTYEGFLERFARGAFFSMSSTIIRRSRLLEVGMLDVGFRRRHDIHMWLRVIRGQTWSFDPRLGCTYRRDTPGSISSKVCEATRYYIRALTDAMPEPRSPLELKIIRDASLFAINIALVHGSSDARCQARELAWPYLSLKHQLLYSIMGRLPFLFRLIRVGRRAIRRLRDGSVAPGLRETNTEASTK